MDIIVLIIIASVISSIVKSVRDVKQQTVQPNKKVVEHGDFPDKGFNLSEINPPAANKPATRKTVTETHRKQSSVQNQSHQNLNTQVQGSQSQISTGIVSSSENLLPVIPKDSDTVTKTQKHHKLDLSANSLINGIILSEVLGPPKSRR